MSGPIIYHGTPMTPRAALLDVCVGRAICISFFRPDDVEAAEAISPAIMFRQWRVLILEGGVARRAGLGRNAEGLDSVFRVAGAAFIPSRSMGCDPGYSWSAKPAQRCAFERLAVWAEGCATLAYGWANRAIAEALRQVRQGMFGLDRGWQNAGHSRISRKNGRGRCGSGQSMAHNSHDAWDTGGVRLSVSQRGQHITGSEWVAV